MDDFSREKLLELHPSLTQKILKLENLMLANGIELKILEGMRSWQRQDELYQQGRTKPGRIVTNAPAGHSYHNFGLACDCAPLTRDRLIDWSADHPQWKLMERLGTSIGLESGASWLRLADAPHFQLVGRFPSNGPSDEVRLLFKEGGVIAVWQSSQIDTEGMIV